MRYDMTQMVGVGMVAVYCVCGYCSITSLNCDLVEHLLGVSSSHCFIHGCIISWMYDIMGDGCTIISLYHPLMYHHLIVKHGYISWVFHIMGVSSFYCIISWVFHIMVESSSHCFISWVFHIMVESVLSSHCFISLVYHHLIHRYIISWVDHHLNASSMGVSSLGCIIILFYHPWVHHITGVSSSHCIISWVYYSLYYISLVNHKLIVSLYQNQTQFFVPILHSQ